MHQEIMERKASREIDSVIQGQCINGYAPLVPGKTVLSFKKVTQR